MYFMERIIGKPLNGIYAFQTNGFVDYQEDVPSYYDQQGTLYYQTNGSYAKYEFMKPVDYNFVYVNCDSYIDYNDQVYVGSALPQISGGLITEFQWKNIDLNMSCAYSLGRHIINATIKRTFDIDYGYLPFVFDIRNTDFWSSPEENADYPMWQSVRMNMNADTDMDVEKVNYLKLKTLTVGYTLPRAWSKKVGMSECRFFVSGENLLTWTNYSGLDPETVDITTGRDNQDTYPLARKYTIGLTLKF